MARSKVYDFPIKTFDPNNLLEEMLNAKEGCVFVLGDKHIKNPEGDDTVELTFVQIMKARDSSSAKKKES